MKKKKKPRGVILTYDAEGNLIPKKPRGGIAYDAFGKPKVKKPGPSVRKKLKAQKEAMAAAAAAAAYAAVDDLTHAGGHFQHPHHHQLQLMAQQQQQQMAQQMAQQQAYQGQYLGPGGATGLGGGPGATL